jgi:hypothetical protein
MVLLFFVDLRTISSSRTRCVPFLPQLSLSVFVFDSNTFETVLSRRRIEFRQQHDVTSRFFAQSFIDMHFLCFFNKEMRSLWTD